MANFSKQSIIHYFITLFIFLFAVLPIHAMRAEELKASTKRKVSVEETAKKRRSARIKNKVTDALPHAKIFLQNYATAKKHPASGGNLENSDRVEKTGEYLKAQFTSSIRPAVITEKSIKEIVDGLTSSGSTILKFLSQKNKLSSKRERLRKERDLVLDDHHSVLVAQHAACQHLHAMRTLLAPDNDITRVLSLARPPGHHACEKEAKGFCLINYIGVLLLSKELEHKNLLIIDFDMHHGDGSQKILNNHPRRFAKKIQFIDVHVETPDDESSKEPKFFPGSYFRPDKENETFIHNIPVEHEKFTLHNVLELIKSQIKKIRVDNPEWLPKLVLFSAGFDGHIDDKFGGKFLSKDYGILAKALLHHVADTFGFEEKTIPALAILEGGYQPAALQTSMAEFFRGLSGATESIEGS